MQQSECTTYSSCPKGEAQPSIALSCSGDRRMVSMPMASSDATGIPTRAPLAVETDPADLNPVPPIRTLFTCMRPRWRRAQPQLRKQCEAEAPPPARDTLRDARLYLGLRQAVRLQRLSHEVDDRRRRLGSVQLRVQLPRCGGPARSAAWRLLRRQRRDEAVRVPEVSSSLQRDSSRDAVDQQVDATAAQRDPGQRRHGSKQQEIQPSSSTRASLLSYVYLEQLLFGRGAAC